MKWEPVAAMIALLLLGMWVVYGPQIRHEVRPGGVTTPYRFGPAKGDLEMVQAPTGERTFRFLPAFGSPTDVFTEAQMRLPPWGFLLDDALRTMGNPVFRALNITSYTSLVWVSIGFIGQLLFFGRMFIQWLVSEKKKEVSIPESFWWFSLFGGILLFTYFAWRQDPVGVLGQTSGVVIYARNLRLIHKRKRREQRGAPGDTPRAA